MADPELLSTLLEYERRGWESLCNSTGGEFYGDLMTDDGLMVLANGAVLDRSAVVDSLRDAPPWRTFDISEPRLASAGPDAFALVYVGSAYRDDDAPAFVGAMASVYVREGDRWRLALYQQTPMPSQSS